MLLLGVKICLFLAASCITQTKVSLARMSQHTQRGLATPAKSTSEVHVRVPCPLLPFVFVKKADQLVAEVDHQFTPLNTADQDPIRY